eukprot:TRINITY_DN58389_c0_g1_i1.p1 TRINITY_DN58389_c0_g1~~TRINITY_DN58389_c0_g1_i1.p1  ORF type:complete len:303 (-),score=24.80 TRINITY_DN58389_c0_g1_i1:24-932(-)
MGALQSVEADYFVQHFRDGRRVPMGEGAFAEVRSCVHRRTHEQRAIKTIQKTDWKIRNSVLEEVRIMKMLAGGHPSIIQFYDLYEEWSSIHIIMGLCTGGTLDDVINEKRLPGGAKGQASFAHQLLEVLAFLKSCLVLHRDVKPANILLASDVTIKLCDFGVSCQISEKEKLRDNEGTPGFWSPEMYMLPKGKGYSFPADLWAAGVTIYMMLFDGVHPFMGNTDISIRLIKRGDYSVGWLTDSCTSSLLGWMLMPSPAQRIAVVDALRHPWFATYDLGPGDFTDERPPKRVPDSHGNWIQVG